MVTVYVPELLETAHTSGVLELKVTARFELAVAVTVNGATPKSTLLNGPKVIV
jgi:hypothetical protein